MDNHNIYIYNQKNPKKMLDAKKGIFTNNEGFRCQKEDSTENWALKWHSIYGFQWHYTLVISGKLT